MAGRIWIGPYKPLGIGTQAVPGGGYINVGASAGQFGPSPLPQVGLQAAEGAAGAVTAVSEHLAGDNEALVKGADARLGETHTEARTLCEEIEKIIENLDETKDVDATKAQAFLKNVRRHQRKKAEPQALRQVT